jgi:hypothetical protein
MDCGKRFPPCAMDFDHRPNEEKLFQISSASTKNRETLLAEIAKCDCVCKVCHRIRTHNRAVIRRSNKPVTHDYKWREANIWPLKDRPCEECGAKFHPVAMDFDHIDFTTKNFSISHIPANTSMDAILAEIDLCQLLCACCHAVKSHIGGDVINARNRKKQLNESSKNEVRPES